MTMSAITGFVIWICRKFDRDQVKKIVEELSVILKNPKSAVQPRAHFDEEHPNYRDFKPDTNVPLTEAQLPDKKKTPKRKRTTE